MSWGERKYSYREIARRRAIEYALSVVEGRSNLEDLKTLYDNKLVKKILYEKILIDINRLQNLKEIRLEPEIYLYLRHYKGYIRKIIQYLYDGNKKTVKKQKSYFRRPRTRQKELNSCQFLETEVKTQKSSED